MFTKWIIACLLLLPISSHGHIKHDFSLSTMDRGALHLLFAALDNYDKEQTKYYVQNYGRHLLAAKAHCYALMKKSTVSVSLGGKGRMRISSNKSPSLSINSIKTVSAQRLNKITRRDFSNANQRIKFLQEQVVHTSHSINKFLNQPSPSSSRVSTQAYNYVAARLGKAILSSIVEPYLKSLQQKIQLKKYDQCVRIIDDTFKIYQEVSDES